MEHYYDAVVIGGGATGAGVLRDLVLRGISAALVERGDLASGTSGRFHGLLHSGCRYALKDPEAARECISENEILRRIAPQAIDVKEGLFVQTKEDDPAYADQWADACQRNGIAVREIGTHEARRQDPCLHPDIARVFVVPDGSVDSWRLVQANVRGALSRGAAVYLWHQATAVRVENGQVTGVEVLDRATGRQFHLGCRMVVNAAGPWVGEIGRMAGVEIPLALDKGTMLVFDHHLSPRVINRLRLPGDGDVLVPVGSVAVLGTSAIKTEDPEDRATSHEVITRLVDIGAQMVPALRHTRILRTYVGTRSLYRPPSGGGSQRDISRGAVILDHEAADGLKGMVSVASGKLTTYRMMAEQVVDVVASRLGVQAPCLTDKLPLLEDAASAWMPLAESEAKGDGTLAWAMNLRRGRRLISDLPAETSGPVIRAGAGPLLCECEGVDEAELIAVAQGLRHLDLNDIRRRTRLGMGQCQGTLCAFRAVGMLHRAGLATGLQTRQLLCDFLAQRWSGVRWTTSVQQLRQNQITRGLYLGNLNLQPTSVPAGRPEGRANV